LTDDVYTRPFADKFLAVVFANVRKFVGDLLNPFINIIGSQADVIFSDWIAPTYGISRSRGHDKNSSKINANDK
jgi:hypothetical protein